MDIKDTECILEPLSLDHKENGLESSGVSNLESSCSKQNIPEKKSPHQKLWGWSLQGMTLVVLSVIVVSASITIALIISLLVGLQQIQPHGVVSSESTYCSRLGLDILEKHGGNAVDAAVVTSFCITVTRPDVASLAGCGLILVRERNSQTSHLYDSMCTAPAGAQQPDESKPLTFVGVPGFLRGLAAVHHRFGKIPWPDLFEGVIKLASDGFKPEPALTEAAALATSLSLPGIENIIDRLKNFGGDVYLPPPELQTILHHIAQRGIDYFYLDDGDDASFTRRITSLMNSFGISWAVSELPSYVVKQPKAIQMGFAGFTVETFPTPSGGPFLLNVLSNLDLMDVISPLDHAALARNVVQVTGTVLHRLLEVAKFAQIATQNLGDPYDSLIANSVLSAQDKLLSLPERRAFVGNLSDVHASNVTPPPSSPQFNSKIGSTGILTSDSTGLTVVINLFLGSPFGTGIIVPGTGVHLNSALRLFSTQSNTSLNTIAPGRRPLVPVSPVYLSTTHRKCGLRFGVASRDGFPGIFDAAQVISNAALFLRSSTCHPQFAVDSYSYSGHSAHPSNETHITSDYTPAADLGCINAQVAIELPRLFLNTTGAATPVFSVAYEYGYEQELVRDLANRGHQIEEYIGAWRGLVTLAGWDKHRLITSGDKRGNSLSLLSY